MYFSKNTCVPASPDYPQIIHQWFTWFTTSRWVWGKWWRMVNGGGQCRPLTVWWKWMEMSGGWWRWWINVLVEVGEGEMGGNWHERHAIKMRSLNCCPNPCPKLYFERSNAGPGLEMVSRCECGEEVDRQLANQVVTHFGSEYDSVKLREIEAVRKISGGYTASGFGKSDV